MGSSRCHFVAIGLPMLHGNQYTANATPNKEILRKILSQVAVKLALAIVVAQAPDTAPDFVEGVEHAE